MLRDAAKAALNERREDAAFRLVGAYVHLRNFKLQMLKLERAEKAHEDAVRKAAEKAAVSARKLVEETAPNGIKPPAPGAPRRLDFKTKY